MRFLWPQLAAWLDARESFALATVTAVSGSAPRAPGCCMAIMPESSRFIGSVSSGCLDAEVVEAARLSLRTRVTQFLRFGPDGNPPWTDGLTCGGWIAVRIEPWWTEVGPVVRRWLELDLAGVVVSRENHHVAISADGVITGDHGAFATEVLLWAKEHLHAERPPLELPDGVFLRTILRRPRLWIVGGGDVTVHLVALVRELGLVATVVDPRTAFVAAERFHVAPAAVLRAWPQDVIAGAGLGPRDAALVLTHDPKIDDPALLALLRTPVGYVGALGSTRSHAARLERLREAGAGDSELARIHGPAGIHLGTPAAAGIALGIAAGLAQWRARHDQAATS